MGPELGAGPNLGEPVGRARGASAPPQATSRPARLVGPVRTALSPNSGMGPDLSAQCNEWASICDLQFPGHVVTGDQSGI